MRLQVLSKKAWDVLKLGTKKRFGAKKPGGKGWAQMVYISHDKSHMGFRMLMRGLEALHRLLHCGLRAGHLGF